jgi:hypothetical protein
MLKALSATRRWFTSASKRQTHNLSGVRNKCFKGPRHVTARKDEAPGLGHTLAVTLPGDRIPLLPKIPEGLLAWLPFLSVRAVTVPPVPWIEEREENGLGTPGFTVFHQQPCLRLLCLCTNFRS